MNKLEKEFLDKALVQPDGLLIFNKKDSINFVKACEKETINILRIDAFFLVEDGIQPSMENSIDYTTGYDYNFSNVYLFSEEFIKEQPDNLYFKIVCKD